MCVCIDIYTIFFSYPTPPMPHPTPPTPRAPPPPPTWGWGGVVRHWGCGVLDEHRVHQPQSPNFFPHRNPVPKQGEKLNGHYHMLDNWCPAHFIKISCTINEAHKQHSLLSTIFYYIFNFGRPGQHLYLSTQNLLHVGRLRCSRFP